MTKAQKEAIAQITKIMNLNFPSWLLTYKNSFEDMSCNINHDWHGDISDVVGLARIACVRLDDRIRLPPPREGVNV